MKNIYPAKTLFTGKAIGLDDDSYYVAVPDFKLKGGCIVWFQGEKMTIKNGQKPITFRHQPQLIEDKRLRGIPYIVGYFRWNPDKIHIVEDLINVFQGIIGMPEKYRDEIRRKLGIRKNTS